MTGAQIVLKVLQNSGCDTLFGYPGGAVIPLFDALYDELDHFDLFRPAHEQNGVHAAEGFARSTGKLGVFIATSGPGITNAVTGIATAFMDSVPLLVISGQVANVLIGKDSFQEIDATGTTISITKHNCLVRKIEDLQEAMEECIFLATSGRPGPVHIDIPKDIFTKEYEYKEKTEFSYEYKKFDENNLKEAISLIKKAKKPVIYAGGGIRISRTDDLLLKLAEKIDTPVTNSFMGLGTIPRDHRLSLGFLGMHGFKETNMAVTNCDLLIAIGSRFSDRVIGNPDCFASGASIIHIDIDATEVDKNTKNCIPIIGDLKEILIKLIDGVEETSHEGWLNEIMSLAVDDNIKDDEFVPKNILRNINKFYVEDTIVATDVGQHQMWTGQFWNFKKSSEFVTSGGLGTMGFGLGAIIGSAVGNRNKNAILITGDGSFRMSSQELVTISKYKLPVKIVMLNNNVLGMVRQWQTLFSNKRYSETFNGCDDVNYLALANAYNIKSFKASTLEQLNEILENTKDYNEPMFIECLIDKDCSVFPIVPPGKAIDNLLLENLKN